MITITKSILNFAEHGYSQNGEWGILREVFRRLKIKKGVSCEFGAADGSFCSNTRNLINQGWSGYLIEADQAGYLIMKNDTSLNAIVIHSMVTPENVNQIVPLNTNLLSIDVDGSDYEIWEAHTGAPDVVVIEINSGKNPDEDFYHPRFGANFSIMNKLAENKNYFLLCHTGNCIYVHSKHKHLFRDADTTFNDSWL